jgi:hypothetical protein
MPGYAPGYYGPGPGQGYDRGYDDRNDNGGGMNPMRMMTSPMKMFGGNKD